MSTEGEKIRETFKREMERVGRRYEKLKVANFVLSARLRTLGDHPTEDRGVEMVRADGGAVCEGCGLTFRDHPAHPVETYATMLCDGRYVKL